MLALYHLILKKRLTASTLAIDAAAGIAELLAASALHVIAALRFLDPVLAEGALLVFGALNEFFECLFIKVRVLAHLVLLASHCLVEGSSAVQAIPSLAKFASEIGAVYSSIENESILAVSTWAPRNVILKADGLLEGVLLKLFHLLLSQYFVHVHWRSNNLALRKGTEKWALRVFNLNFQVVVQAILMKDVVTVEQHEDVALYLIHAYLALMPLSG